MVAVIKEEPFGVIIAHETYIPGKIESKVCYEIYILGGRGHTRLFFDLNKAKKYTEDYLDIKLLNVLLWAI